MRAPPSESLRASRRATANCGSVNVHTDWISHGSYSRLAQLALPRRVMRLQNSAGRLPAAYFTCCRVQNAPIAGMCLLVSLVASLDVSLSPAGTRFRSLTSRPGSRRAGSARCCLFEFVVFPDPCDRAILQAEQSDTGGGRTCGVRAQRRTGPRRSEPSAPRAVDRPRGEPLTIPPAPRKNPCVYPRADVRAPRYTDAEKSKRPHRTHRMFGSPW